MNMKVTPSPRIDSIGIEDGTATVFLETNSDDTVHQYVIEFTDKQSRECIDVQFSRTCKVQLICQVTGNTLIETTETTPDWAHVYVACDVQAVLEREANESFLDSCY